MTLIETYKEKLIALLKSSKPIIIEGPTGSGKSTYLPQLIHKIFPEKKVAFLQPRRVATVSLYDFLKSKIPLSYKIRHQKKINKRSNITMMTDGLFLMEYHHRENIDYDIVIIDEIHEMNIRTELLLYLLHRKNIKLIFMSATGNFLSLKKYFKASIFSFKGSAHPLSITYEQQPVADYIEAAHLKIREILNSDLQGDILIFLPGEECISDLYCLLKKIPYLEIFKIYSQMETIDQKKIFARTNKRKVILSTNICETSITIPSVKIVIDCGLVKEKIFQEIFYFGIRRISRESADQRAGRANRTGPGHLFRLYTENEYSSMEHNRPASQYDNLNFFLLYLLRFQFKIQEMKFINSLDRNNFFSAVEKLKKIKAVKITKDEILITPIGRSLLYFPINIDLAYFLLVANRMDCGNIAAMLCSLLSLENFIFLRDRQQKGDLLVLFELFKNFYEEPSREIAEMQLRERKISVEGMRRAVLIYDELKRFAKGDQIENIENAFREAYGDNIAYLQTDGSYIHKNKQAVYVFPNSYYFKRKPKMIVFLNVIFSSKPYANIVCPI